MAAATCGTEPLKCRTATQHRACGCREPSVNQKRRANHDVAFNAHSDSSAVNSSTDTRRLFYGSDGCDRRAPTTRQGITTSSGQRGIVGTGSLTPHRNIGRHRRVPVFRVRVLALARNDQ